MENKNAYSNPEKNDELINLMNLVKIFTKNWKWFALSVFLFLGIGVYYLLTKNPVYAVDALALLKEDDKKSGSNTSMISAISNLSDLGSMMGSKNIDNEVVVFNTRKLMKQSILDLNMYVTFAVHDGLKTVNPYPYPPFNVSVDSLQVDTIQGVIEFTMKPAKNGAYKVKGKYNNIKFSTQVDRFPAIIRTPSIDVHIDKNPLGLMDEDPKTVDIKVFNPNMLAILLKKEITVEATNKKTTVIRLSTQTDNVKWAQDLLTKLIESFNRDAVEDKKMISTLTAKFVEDRIVNIEKELGTVEIQAQKYKQDNNLTDISSEAKLFLEQMSDFGKTRIETQIQLNMIQYVEEYVKNEKNKNSLIPSIGIEDKSLVAVIAKYNEMLAERNKLESTSTTSNPALQMANTQLVTMRQNILENINKVAGSMKIALKDIEGQDVITNRRIKAIPRQEREYTEIRRQQEIKATLFSFLLQKKEETNLSLAATIDKAKIIDEPMPGLIPVAPKKMIILFIFLCLGIGIPFAFFYLKKLLTTEIDSKEELESLSKAELIGEICNTNLPDKIIVKANETNSAIELFRLLRTNLSFILGNSGQKVILLTSTVSGEGKTYISINLASSLALIDKKIVVVGLDIRNPRLGGYMDTPTGKGITNYLIDNNLKVTDIIQRSGIHPNMDIIQAGTTPPNPNELLMKPRLDELFNDLRDRYDYIIVDTAPVGLVSDTFLLNRITDICLYIVRIGVAHKDSVKYLNSIRDQGKLKNLYVVANGINLKAKNGGYGYGYGSK
ncbi:MAG: polysaccharide biosynthesis tyrosine autokinase [Dysgonamonadaceae bacterium]|jgi:capsular exopolysaccharide synthesis family protein|nr:polysaccharide biosynthesis tyrosine autokinase [Dysgonamonadaceae bacterium]